MRTTRVFLYLVTVVLLIVWSVNLGCKSSKKQVKIVVDLENGHGWTLMEGDSIWYQQPVFVTDSSNDDISFGHSLPQDTLFGLKNLNPVVIIAGADTSRYYFNDTVRYSICKPDTVVKIVYRGIQNAENVYIGGN